MDTERLKKYRYNRLELRRIEMQIEDMDGDLEPRATQITGLPSARGQDHDARMISVIQRRATLVQRYLDLKAAIFDEQMQIEIAIHKIPQPWQLVLAYRYLTGMPWRKIEDMTHYGYPRLQQLHREGLEKIRSV
jgi:hypothetical protein|nr:MAG TPA: Protein of unknown function (DUF1492) [Caudoviricetes sp.]DAM92534.1 MAG TPA: Protein of unknown function (DUF1492) [Caudoviricetes sp.]DAO90035.1 MAG TPA: Protein of unknown function (DUF1492) [Caudoviricetes sp.]DAU72853.1 MAG TPA: Protein of unknown function (DUF1492) [Caudoviricetes sp.]